MFTIFRKSKIDQRSTAALEQVELIEAEMKRIGYWAATQSDLHIAITKAELRNFTEPPSFQLWLQCIFMPNARKSATDGEFPEKSQIGLVAMQYYDYYSLTEEAQPLMLLLSKFDAIIEKRD